MALLPEHPALQHERAPRPLPLFLQLVRDVAAHNPEVARAALRGLARYGEAKRPAALPVDAGPRLVDHGGDGPPVFLVPSLINPPSILDLDPGVSLVGAIRAMGRRVFAIDWGRAAARRDWTVARHVEHGLLPMLRSMAAPPALIGYCLGGTMAIAAAALVPVERLVTLAAPWHFRRYPDDARSALEAMWRSARPAAQSLGLLPMEVLQAAFWSLDPLRTVDKFARFAELPAESAAARRFVELEDWANDGEALPVPSARELLEDFFRADAPGRGAWVVGGQPIGEDPGVPALHFTALRDRIAPAATAASGPSRAIDAGHVGMIVGSARGALHAALAEALAAPPRAG